MIHEMNLRTGHSRFFESQVNDHSHSIKACVDFVDSLWSRGQLLRYDKSARRWRRRGRDLLMSTVKSALAFLMMAAILEIL